MKKAKILFLSLMGCLLLASAPLTASAHGGRHGGGHGMGQNHRQEMRASVPCDNQATRATETPSERPADCVPVRDNQADGTQNRVATDRQASRLQTRTPREDCPFNGYCEYREGGTAEKHQHNWGRTGGHHYCPIPN